MLLGPLVYKKGKHEQIISSRGNVHYVSEYIIYCDISCSYDLVKEKFWNTTYEWLSN